MKNYHRKQNPVQTSSSVQEVSKQDAPVGRLSPTHLSYWEGRVFLPTYKRKGKLHKTANYSCKIQFAGRRESFPLHTANCSEAAQKARDIYLVVVRWGWDEALKKHKPKPTQPVTVLTVAELFRLVALTGLITASTMMTYKTKLRTLIAFICKLGIGRGRGVRYLEWRQKVDAQPISVVTLEAVKEFRRHMLARGTETPRKLYSAGVTLDGYIRNLRSLFRAEMLEALKDLGAVVEPMPFDKVPMAIKGRSAFRYVSIIQPEKLMREAIDELSKAHPEPFKIFLLALLLGFRRTEIDKLRWDMVNWERKHIALIPHEFLHLKTANSSDEIRVEPDFLLLLKQYKEISRSDYVVHSDNLPRKLSTYRHYRCDAHFKFLTKWLRAHGVNTQKPIHTLRKECGSLVTERFGIMAAKTILRHATIDITVTYYASDRRAANTGLDTMLPKDGIIDV